MDAQPNEPARQDETDWDNEPDLFDTVDEAAEDEAYVQAEKEFAAGKGVPHEEVSNWLRTWGTADYKPPPREWFE